MFLFIFVVFLGREFVTGNTDADVHRLVQDLKSNYTFYARPPRDQSQVLTVYVGFSLNAIKEFDEVNDKFSVTGSVIMSWEDDRLQWKPEEYGGVDHVLVNNDVFWTPPLYLQNSIDEAKKIGEEPYWKVRFQSLGFAVFYPGASLSAVCTARVFNFPWDKHYCYLSFTLIGYTGGEIDLKPFRSEYLDPLQYFFGDGLWDVEGWRADTLESTITIGFHMRRKPLLAVVNIILPVLLMSFLNIMVFLIPAESGERISFCLTVLLAIAVFLTLVSDSMPKSATSIAFLSYYLVAVLSLSILITIGTIINLKIYFKDEDIDVPQWLQKFSRGLLCKRNQGRTNVKTMSKDSSGIIENTHRAFTAISDNNPRNIVESNGPYKTSLGTNGFRPGLNPHYQGRDTTKRSAVYIVSQHKTRQYLNGRRNSFENSSSLTSQNRAVDETSDDDRKSKEVVTWKIVSVAVDIMFFSISCVLMVAMTSVFFIVATTVNVDEEPSF